MKLSRACMFPILSALFFFLSAPGFSFASEEKIIIFPFDGSADNDISEVRDALPLLMTSRLSMPGRISVHAIDQQQLGEAQKLRLMSRQEKLSRAQQLGAAYCLTGRITRVGQSMSIDALLETVRGDEQQTSLSVQIPGKDATIAQVTKLCSQIKQAVFAKDVPPPAPSPKAAASQPAPLPATGQRAFEQPEDIPPPPPKRTAAAAGPPATILLAPPAPASSKEGADSSVQKPPKYLAVPRQPGQRSGNPLFVANAAASYAIKGPPLTMLATGDVNGDGRKELLLAGPEALYVYTIGPDAALAPAENISIGKNERPVHIDTGDFNGNGIEEIYVSSYDGTASNSFVIEYRDGAYQRLAEKLPWFFRSYARPGAAPSLIGQVATVGNPFAGDILHLRWSGQMLVAGDKMKLPLVCGIYSFAEFDINSNGRPDFFVFQRGVFDSTLKLTILTPESKTLWQDPHGLGDTALFFKRTASLNQSELKEPIPMRILCGRPSSGQPFLIVGKNAKKGDSFFNFLLKNTQGAACCLLWNGSAFEYNWASDFAKDFVADYILDDVDKDGAAELFVLAVTGEVTGNIALNRIQMFRRR